MTSPVYSRKGTKYGSYSTSFFYVCAHKIFKRVYEVEEFSSWIVEYLYYRQFVKLNEG